MSEFFIIFQQNKVKFLICTDVAARGIDVKGIPYGELPQITFCLFEFLWNFALNCKYMYV